MGLVAILIFHKAGAVILEPGSWILTPATRRRLRIPSAERRPAGAARAGGLVEGLVAQLVRARA